MPLPPTPPLGEGDYFEGVLIKLFLFMGVGWGVAA